MKKETSLFDFLPLAAVSLLMFRILEGQRKMERIFIYAVVGLYLVILIGLFLILTMRFAHGA